MSSAIRWRGKRKFAKRLTDVTPRVIRTAHQRAGFDMTKPELFARHFEFVEFIGRDVSVDFQLAVLRLQILPESDDVDLLVAQLLQRDNDLVMGFADPKH
jgi:hypothetical protein